jgi:MFS family permease
VLLLPYSLVGPFAGVLLDRWRRQRVLVRANLVRSAVIVLAAAELAAHGATGLAFYATGLVALSVNRFYLTALSASLPHVVRRDQLLLANSVSTTTGTFATVLGLGIGLGVRAVAGAGDDGDAVVAVTSDLGYLTAAAAAAGFAVAALGPATPHADLAAALRRVLRDLADGARHVAARPLAAHALAAMAGSRLLYGLSTIATLLLYRNYFTDSGPLRAGLVGLGQVVTVSAVGYVVAALVTPVATARLGKERWIVAVFALAAVAQGAAGAPFRMGPLLVGALVVGFAAQSAKLCADTIVQEEVDDDFRGRVFSFYDTAFNLTFVAAAVLAAFTLPRTGRSYVVLAAIATGYAAIAVGFAAGRRWRVRATTARAATPTAPVPEPTATGRVSESG